jgi:hypothetical protein
MLTAISASGGNFDELTIIDPDTITSSLITEKQKEKTFNLYPNPLTKGTLSIDMIGYKNMRDVQLKIINMMGQTVYQKNINNPTHLEINTTGILEKSIYFISVKSGDKIAVRKLVVN